MTESGTASTAEVQWAAEQAGKIVDNVGSFIRGKQRTIQYTVVCLLAGGHLLLEDVPGTGKTSLARALSASVDASVRRIQFTPDLLPSDVTGVTIFNQDTRQFEFHPGAVFANILLADEINRASPKTQSALLEVMEEGAVTVDGRRHVVPHPFFVIATDNPIEMAGTYELPEAQLDRFMIRMSVNYPDAISEAEVVQARAHRRTPEDLRPVITLADLSRMMDVAARVHLAPKVVDFIVAISAATRTMSELALGASPRASVTLAIAAQALALTHARNFVTPDDVKTLAKAVLCHRLVLRPEAELEGHTAESLIGSVLDSVPVPNVVPSR